MRFIGWSTNVLEARSRGWVLLAVMDTLARPREQLALAHWDSKEHRWVDRNLMPIHGEVYAWLEIPRAPHYHESPTGYHTLMGVAFPPPNIADDPMPGESTVDITGLDHAAVLVALHSASRGQFRLIPRDTSLPELPLEEARKLVEEYEYHDYVDGRVIKVLLLKGATELDPYLYDRDNGRGAAAAAIQKLRERIAQGEQDA